MKRLLKCERGSSLVVTAMTIAVLTGFAALAVDGGYLYYRHTQLQDLSDSAALAATAQMAMGSGDQAEKRQLAFAAAVKCVQRNGYEVSATSYDSADVSRGDEAGNMSVHFSEDDRTEVGVAVSMNVPLFFGRAISISSSTVQASSAAQLRPDGLVPICFFEGGFQVKEKYALTLGPGDGVKGNYSYLDFNPSSKFQEYLADGFSGSLDLGDVIETYTGVNTGQVKQAIDERISRCTHGCSVTDLRDIGDGVIVSVTQHCPRLVLIPIVGGFYEQDGKGLVTVIGFVRFFIENYDQGTKVLTGWCLGEVGPNGTGTMSGFAIREVKLVK